MRYESPTVTDYGTMLDMTAATAILGTEDGASKTDTAQHHSLTLLP